jgi:transmembrane sensor
MKLRVAYDAERSASNDAAAEWLMLHDRGPLSAADENRFRAWLAERPENAAAYERSRAAWEAFEGATSDPDFLSLRQQALRAAPSRRRFWLPVGAAIAASIGAALLIIPGAIREDISRPATTSVTKVASAQAVQPNLASFSTMRGERRVVALPDGSSVTLNTDTAIELAFSAGKRLIRMSRGQALFEVAKDHTRPFVVEAGGRQVTALGTIFSVRMDPGRVRVLLVRGRVVVDKVDGEDSSTTVKPTILSPGQELVAELGAVQHIAKADVSSELLWKDGYIEFHDARLGDAVAEMNRYSDRQIALSDPRIAQMRVSGVFKTGDPDRFASLVSELLPLTSRPVSTGDVQLVATSQTAG